MIAEIIYSEIFAILGCFGFMAAVFICALNDIWPNTWKKILRGTGIFLLGFMLQMWIAIIALSMYNWFLLPAFYLPEIQYWQAFGIILLVTLLTSQYNRSWWEEEWQDIYLWSFTQSFKIFIIGWVVHFWV